MVEPTTPASRRTWSLIALETLIAISAVYGGVGLIWHNVIGMPDDWLQAARIGVAWSAGAGAVTFDTMVVQHLAGDTWTTVLNAYDLSQGRIWGLVVAVIGGGPCAARYRRLWYTRP